MIYSANRPAFRFPEGRRRGEEMTEIVESRREPGKESMKSLLRMIAVIAVPVALQNLLTTTGSMIDTMMIASRGENAVGAVGLCAQFSNLMFAGYWGFVGGGMLFFAQFWGAKNGEGIKKSYGMTLAFMMISGLFFGGWAVLAPGSVMRIFTDSAVIREIGVKYLQIVGFAFPVQVIATAMSALLRSIERVRIPLIAGIASVVTNLCCNYVLIFGRFGFPELGVRGAAIGTVAAACMNVIVLVVFIRLRRIPFVLEFSGHFRWNAALLKEYLVKCFPIICNEVLIGVGNMMISIVLGHQAESAIAATAVLRTIEGMVIGFFAGFSSAATVLVGKEVGAGNHETAFNRAWRIIYFCAGVIACLCIVLLAIHTPLLHAMGLSGESFSIGTGMLVIYCVVAMIRMSNWAMNDTYRSAGDSAFGSVMEITFMFLMVQPVIHLANDYFHAPFLLVFALCYVDEPVRFVIMQIHMYSRRWIKPVSDEGKATIDAYREKYGVKTGGFLQGRIKRSGKARNNR